MRTPVSFLFYEMRRKLIRTIRESQQKLVVAVGRHKSHLRIPYSQCRTYTLQLDPNIVVVKET